MPQSCSSTRRSALGTTKPPPKPQLKRQKTIWIYTKPTDLIESHYTIGRKLGQAGQYGECYSCIRNSDNASFAVKKISKSRLYRLDKHPGRRARALLQMRNEISIMQRLRHNYIVRLESIFEDKHNLWIVMEQCHGGELFARIQQKKKI